jgi:hypothetical protein
MQLFADLLIAVTVTGVEKMHGDRGNSAENSQKPYVKQAKTPTYLGCDWG